MKRFFISFLGALAGVWVSVLLFGVLVILFIAVMAASSAGSPEIPDIKKNSVLHIKLTGEVVDRQTPRDIMAEIYGESTEQIALNTLVGAIENAADDDDIKGIFLDCKGMSAGLAQLQAIVKALQGFGESGKWIMAYGDSYTQGDYIIASSVADSLFVNPAGSIDIHGLSATTMYFKNLLEKAGVEVQVVKVGTFKSAVEPFILNDMSEANRLQTNTFLQNIWGCLREEVADGRRVDSVQVNQWADGYTYTKETGFYIDSRMADATLYRHQMDSLLARASGLDEDEDKPELVSYDKYAAARNINGKSGKGKRQIAVLYALGDITENGSGGIASERLVPQILDLADNEDVEALVLRVNSGGGSAYASEQIWEALEQFKSRTGKPFYVSMGDYAASGGYYISCGADKIYAEPVTLTGSIGIFGLIPNAQKLLNDKIGINTATVSTNKGAFPNLYSPMSESMKGAMQSMVENGYELFVKRCADGRGVSTDSIKAIAEGRVWDGRKAMEIGLVDCMGGLDAAIRDIAVAIDAEDNYYIKEYPKVKTKWWEEMVDLSKTMEMKIAARIIGEENLRFYTLTKSIREMSPVQARMDYVEIN
jgi:protease-4